MVPEAILPLLFCADWGFQPAFRFELIAIVVSVRPVPDGAQGACIDTVVMAGMPSLRARSVLRCSAIGVRNVS